MDRDELFLNLNEYNYNPMNDVLFKFIFGKEERKQITIDFLNAVLEPSLGHAIQDLAFAPSEMNPEHEGDKLTRLDVACILDTGEQVDVEVQVVNEGNMARRTLFYWSQMYLMSLPAGKTYDDLKPAITVNLLNFSFLPQEGPHAVYGLYNMETGDRLTRDLELHFLELPKYIKGVQKPISQMTKMERWLAYFANRLDKKGKEELAMSEAAIHTAMDAARIFLSNTAERRLYINKEMARMDRDSGLLHAERKGEQKGLQKGEQIGLQRGEQIGLQKGERIGEEKMGQLMQILSQEQNYTAIAMASTDKAFRESLYRKYHIV